MILFTAFMLQAANTQAPPVTNGATVVVTAHRQDSAKERLAACLAHHCPPREDIAAATALVVAQFLAGDYEAARDTAGRAVGRNRRHARELPVEMSDLFALHGALASITGLPEVGKARRFAAVSALKRGLPPDSERIALARLSVADEFARQGMTDDAVVIYDTVARHAAVSGQPAVQGRAMLQAAMLYASAARADSIYTAEVRKRIAAIDATTDPAMQGYRDATVALRGQLATMRGDHRELAKVLAEAQTVHVREPMLIYNPTLDLDQAGLGTTANPLSSVDLADAGIGTTHNADTTETRGQWLTIAFRIAPDGTVQDVRTQDSGRHVTGRWAAAVLRSVAARRYLPLDLPPNAPQLARVERASLVVDMIATTRSRIRTHSGPKSVQFTDLTPAPSRRAGADVPSP